MRNLGSAEQILAVTNGRQWLICWGSVIVWRRIKIFQLKILRLYPYYNPSWEIAAQCSTWRRTGNQYLRLLLVIVITSLVRQTKSHPERASVSVASDPCESHRYQNSALVHYAINQELEKQERYEAQLEADEEHPCCWCNDEGASTSGPTTQSLP